MKLICRLRQDFHLSILALLGACALVGITPFAAWRFINGQWLAGVIDSVILACVIGAVIYAWRTNDTARAGFVLSHIACGGAVLVAVTSGQVGLFWMYPAIVASYFLTSPLVAFYCTLLAAAALLLGLGHFGSAEEMFSFSTTVAVVSACAYVFAGRNERQRKQLEQLAGLDQLTGVSNRRVMDLELAVAVDRHARQQISYGLVIADVDHFKTINDQHGHSVGDSVLLKFAQLLVINTRGSDKVFRFGGEEFLILFPNVKPAQLRRAAEQLQDAVRKSLRSPAGPVTASFGTAVLLDDESLHEWFARADKALYVAKQNGRDRIEAAESLQEAV
jgi:diguanylate cyclase (GGDEF)-like protein